MKRRYSWQVERLRRNLDSRAFLVGALRRRKATRAIVEEGSMDAVRLLAETLTESEHADVREIARAALDALEDWRRISAACEIWVETRHPELTALLMKNEWVASMPPEVKVLTALKLGRLDEVTGGDERFVEPLLAACRDPDPVIAERARQVLPRLEKEEAREGLCKVLIEQEDPLALEVALEADYYPQEQQQRALFFFLTGQWARYEGLDFDQRLLRMAYTVAGESVRRRVREKLREAGRTDFLSVIAGQDYRAQAAEMAPGELDLLMQTLTANREWPELWDLLFEVSFSRSARIVEALAGAGWQPEDGKERALLASLVAFARGEERLPTDDDEVRALFPPALLEAQAQVSGRINDVTFSPLRPVIAIGTGERKVVVWNYRQAEREQLLDVADHSVGNVIFTGNGTLVWSERTNRTDVPCLIYYWQENGADRVPGVLGQHVGSVTALAPVGDDRVLSTGRDRRIVLWDVTNEREVTSSRYHRWPRAVQVSPDGNLLALLHTELTLTTLPGLKTLLSGGGKSVGRCAAFLPPAYEKRDAWDGPEPVPHNQTLLVGQHSGEVFLYYPKRAYWLTYERPPFTRHTGRVEGVSVLESRGVVVTAGSEGIVRFIDLEDRSTIGEVQVPLGKVTSLHVSPDEAFMVVGNSEARLSFWDIRGLDVLDLLLNPFGRAPATALTTLAVLKEDPALPPRAHRTLAFAERVLHHRIRFDIELGAAPTIMAGEFDIEIE
ncbi:MAG: hypothetical protein ACLFU8_15940 [Anaerolineales bacterium]